MTVVKVKAIGGYLVHVLRRGSQVALCGRDPTTFCRVPDSMLVTCKICARRRESLATGRES